MNKKTTIIIIAKKANVNCYCVQGTEAYGLPCQPDVKKRVLTLRTS